MADDWKAGDLALCVRSGPLLCECGCTQHGNHAPAVGHMAVVESIGQCGDELTWEGEAIPCAVPVLFLAGGHSGVGPRFRKIRPLNKAERAAALRELRAPARENV